MAQITAETAFGKLKAGDVFPNGDVVFDVEHKTVTRRTAYGEAVDNITVYHSGKPGETAWKHVEDSEQTYGVAVARAQYLHDNLPYGD